MIIWIEYFKQTATVACSKEELSRKKRWWTFSKCWFNSTNQGELNDFNEYCVFGSKCAWKSKQR